MDPTLNTLQRNRYISGTLFTLGGLALAAFVSPLLGAGLAAGGLAALVGTQLSFAIDPIFQLGAAPAGGSPPATQTAAAPTTQGLGAVFQGNRQMLGAVFQGDRQMLGAVFQGDRQVVGPPRFSSIAAMTSDDRIESNHFGG
jgi:hypothetical protein